jgi:hypothetical protein
LPHVVERQKFQKLKGKVSLSLQTTSYGEENPNYLVSFTVPPLHAVLKKRTLHNSGCLCHFQQKKVNFLIIQTNLMPVMVIQTNDQKEQDQEAIQQKHLRQDYLANLRLEKGRSLNASSNCPHHYKMGTYVGCIFIKITM